MAPKRKTGFAAGTSGSRSAYAEMTPDERHEWLRFDSHSPDFAKRSEVLYKLMNKQFVCPRTPDWGPLEQSGIITTIRNQMTQEQLDDDGGVIYEYGDWEKLFNLWAPIYKELCWEFLATVEIAKSVTSVGETFLTFRLGGQDRRMSILDLASCLGLYTLPERRANYFREYLTLGYKIKDGISKDIWGRLSDEPYSTSSNHVSAISRMEIRVIQRFLSHSISGRAENTEKVTLSDMWYLEKMLDRDNVCIPYCVGWFLAKKAAGRKNESPICGGHYITIIARSFNINCAGLQLVFDPRERVDRLMYIKVKAIMHDGDRFVPYQGDEDEPPRQRQRTGEGGSGVPHGDDEEAEEAAYDQGGFQAPPSQHTYGAPLPGYLDVMHRFENFQLGYDYQQGRTDYNVDWLAHNAQLYYDSPTNYQPTPRHHIPHYGSQAEGYHPPIYNEESALEEAQRLHQERMRQQEAEARYHEEQRRGEQGGSWSPFDWFPF